MVLLVGAFLLCHGVFGALYLLAAPDVFAASAGGAPVPAGADYPAVLVISLFAALAMLGGRRRSRGLRGRLQPGAVQRL
jgi:hypothetical protein